MPKWNLKKLMIRLVELGRKYDRTPVFPTELDTIRGGIRHEVSGCMPLAVALREGGAHAYHRTVLAEPHLCTWSTQDVFSTHITLGTKL